MLRGRLQIILFYSQKWTLPLSIPHHLHKREAFGHIPSILYIEAQTKILRGQKATVIHDFSSLKRLRGVFPKGRDRSIRRYESRCAQPYPYNKVQCPCLSFRSYLLLWILRKACPI